MAELSIYQVSALVLNNKNAVKVTFVLKVVQEALIREVVARMQDSRKFDSVIAKELEKAKIISNDKAVTVGTVSMQRLITKTAVVGFSVSAMVAVTSMVIGCYKLRQMSHEGYSKLDGTASERTRLAGHERL